MKTVLLSSESAGSVVGLKGIVPYFLTDLALENDARAC